MTFETVKLLGASPLFTFMKAPSKHPLDQNDQIPNYNVLYTRLKRKIVCGGGRGRGDSIKVFDFPTENNRLFLLQDRLQYIYNWKCPYLTQ